MKDIVEEQEVEVQLLIQQIMVEEEVQDLLGELDHAESLTQEVEVEEVVEMLLQEVDQVVVE
jgi:hypothetical protein